MLSEHIYHPIKTRPYPPSLTCNGHWSAFRLAWSDQKQKFVKTPIDLKTGLPSNSDAMSGPFSFAVQHLDANMVLNYRHPEGSHTQLGLIDCDNCVLPDGSVSMLVQGLLRYVDSYAEYSVSNGIHVLCWLDDVPPDGHKDRQWDMEFYWNPRSIPVTGNRVVLPEWESPEDPQPRTQEYLKLHKDRFRDAWSPVPVSPPPQPTCALTPDQILGKIFCEHEGRKWAEIYNGNWQGYYESPSDADLALLMKIAFYSNRDRQMMDTIFSGSPLSKILMRGTVDAPTIWRTPKWANQNYRKRTLDTAITRTRITYTPKKSMSAQEFYQMRRQTIHANRKQK